MFAMLRFDEDQTTVVVMSSVKPLFRVAVAKNCSCLPLGKDGLAGVTAIETTTGVVTASVVEPLIDPEVAVIMVKPAVFVLTSPCEPGELLMVAAPGLDEVQVTVVVRS